MSAAASPDLLVGTKLFAGLDPTIATELAAALQVEHAAPGEELLALRSSARCLLLLLSGTAVITMATPTGTEVELRTLGPGDFAGETGVVDPSPRTSRLTVTADTDYVRIPATVLDGLYRREPKAYALVILNIARELARRVRAAEHALAASRAAALLGSAN